MNFGSDTYDWLVVTGAQAQLQGTGTFTGDTSYKFLLTVIDGQKPGAGGVDYIRIKIWDPVTGTVIYDNQPGAPIDASPTVRIGGGSITIHDN